MGTAQVGFANYFAVIVCFLSLKTIHLRHVYLIFYESVVHQSWFIMHVNMGN